MEKNTIKQVAITVFLVIVIIAEMVVGVNLFRKREAYKTGQLIDIAKKLGAPNTTVTNITWYDEVPEPEKGDVIKIDDIKIKLSGVADDSSSKASQYIIYTDEETKSPLQFSYTLYTGQIDKLLNAIALYFANPASTEEIVKLLPVNAVEENLEFYQQSLVEQNIPVLYDNVSESYYMFYPKKDSYYVFSSRKPFVITDEKLTVHYKDPNEDPLRSRVYSQYELDAVNNTIAQMDEEDLADFDGTVLTSSNNNTVSSDNQTWNNETAKAARDSIVSYANCEWNADGTSSNSSLKIDLTSTSAKASEWVLKSEHTSYTYTDSGLNLTGLNGMRDSTAGLFELSGKIQNLENYSRPYALAIMFMDSSGQLLGVKVVDGRTNPIEANGVGEFSVRISKTVDKINVSDIYSVMFSMS